MEDFIYQVAIYGLSVAIGALGALVAYIWRSQVKEISDLKTRVTGLEKELAHYATKAELQTQFNHTENLIRDIRADISIGFRDMNQRIHDIMRGDR